MADEFDVRDADGCEDFESLEEAGLHDDTAPELTEEELAAEEMFSETDDGEPEITEEEDAAAAALAAEKEKYLRLFAEFDNYRKRTAKEKAETYMDAVTKTVQELLPALDSFDRALESPCADEAYKAGMEKIHQQLTGILTKLGVEEIPALNEPFDPKVHNAIRQVEDENFGESTVCEVYQKGYRIGERIVRCAMVPL